jgi:enoyl-CoA hydratase/carnithine racemase
MPGRGPGEKDCLGGGRGFELQAAWITLNRPRLLNALSAEMLASIRRAYEAAGDDRDVRAIVTTGAGRGFCAGADIHVMDNASLESFRASCFPLPNCAA